VGTGWAPGQSVAVRWTARLAVSVAARRRRVVFSMGLHLLAISLAPSIPPERLLKASLLMALYTVRSERMFCEQLDYNLLFRWFLDLNWDEPGFDHSTFGRNRARLLEHDVAGEFFRIDEAVHG
jgi:transposase